MIGTVFFLGFLNSLVLVFLVSCTVYSYQKNGTSTKTGKSVLVVFVALALCNAATTFFLWYIGFNEFFLK